MTDDFTWSAVAGGKAVVAVVYEDGQQPRDTKGRFRKRYVEVIDFREDHDR